MDMFHLVAGDGPIVAAAIHNGHEMRPAVAELCALNDDQRRREEDPFTDVLAEAASTRLIGGRSRFEVDLNRRRSQAVYREPCDAWGLCVWREPLRQAIIDESIANYNLFYATAKALMRKLVAQHHRVVVLDIHSYNHRRNGPDQPAADPSTDPEVNIGTGSMDRAHWAPVVDRFIADLKRHEVGSRRLDVRENVKFFGGHFGASLHRSFPGAVCSIAIEFKKTFMDEWTGEVDREHLLQLQSALRTTLPGILESLHKMKHATPVK